MFSTGQIKSAKKFPCASRWKMGVGTQEGMDVLKQELWETCD